MHYILCKLTIASRYPFRAPTIPIVFNVLGDSPRGTSQGTAKLGLFDQVIGRLMAVAPQDVFIELGPHTSCLPILKANPAVHKDALLLGSLRKQQHATPSATLASSSASCFVPPPVEPEPSASNDTNFIGEFSMLGNGRIPKLAKIASATLHPTPAPIPSGLTNTLQLETVPGSIQRPTKADFRRLPLFFIHDGSGWSTTTTVLRSARSGVLLTGVPENAAFWKGLVDVAGAYLDSILGTCPTGLSLLGGYSLSGVPAYEIALQLTARDVQVKGILLIARRHQHATPNCNAKLTSLVRDHFSMDASMLGEYFPHTTTSLCLDGCAQVPMLNNLGPAIYGGTFASKIP
ncbi:hypothetical protein HMN09_01067000 [Mycena chlorophos]|uniref:Thioesterase domain-containing protein n=1 Tax=Mycena chlorophos TaxID=658473 RepID=A0A8H6SD86_MYCCL|nr:hypothetical protein HMN09_01067000 [Mycena chlorophos]